MTDIYEIPTNVEPADLADDLLDPDNFHAGTVVPLVTQMAKAYTRDHGFDEDGVPNEDIKAVIVVASARLSANGSQVSHAMSVGEFSLDIRNGFNGWTLAELSVLNRYRKRAM